MTHSGLRFTAGLVAGLLGLGMAGCGAANRAGMVGFPLGARPPDQVWPVPTGMLFLFTGGIDGGTGDTLGKPETCGVNSSRTYSFADIVLLAGQPNRAYSLNLDIVGYRGDGTYVEGDGKQKMTVGIVPMGVHSKPPVAASGLGAVANSADEGWALLQASGKAGYAHAHWADLTVTYPKGSPQHLGATNVDIKWLCE
jgi:hypothetical protein